MGAHTIMMYYKHYLIRCIGDILCNEFPTIIPCAGVTKKQIITKVYPTQNLKH